MAKIWGSCGKYKIKRLFILVITILLVYACSSEKHPSNTALIEFFRQNKSDFESLRQMFLEDENLYVIGRYNEGTYVELYNKEKPGISSIREKAYFDLLDKLNVIGIGTYRGGGNKKIIFFNLSGRGGALGGSVKRYMWFNRKATESDVQMKGTYIADFIPIEDNWYLLFEYYG